MILALTIAGIGQVAFFDELVPIYPDTPASNGAVQWVSQGALDVPAGVHLLLDPVSTGMIEVTVTGPDGDRVDELAIFRLHDVPVEENTGLDSRTEQFKNTINPHVIRRAPFRIYEALEPLAARDGRLELPVEDEPVALRLEVQPSVAGRRDLVVHVEIDGTGHDLPWSIQAYDWRPPERSGLEFGYTNWFSPTNMSQRHGVEPWSEASWSVLEDYAKLMVRGGQDTFWVRWPDFFESTPGGWRLNESRLDRYIRIFLAAGMYRIEGAPFARRPGGDWSTSHLELSIPGVPASSKAGREILVDLAGQLREFMIKRGWMDQWVQHIADEPTDVNAEDYARVSAHLHELLPGVPVIEATMTQSLVGSVDIWCPQVHKYQQNQAFFNERKSAGDQVWTYTCLVPGGPWLNRLMDQERLRSVYFAWAAVRFDVDGFLHWGLNHYKADPFEQSVVDHPAMPGTTNKLPAGDTHVVFPGPSGPWSSTRFEAQRIGLEDLAALRVIHRSNPGLCDELVGRVFRGYDDWERDVEAYRAVRRELLEAVSRQPTR